VAVVLASYTLGWSAWQRVVVGGALAVACVVLVRHVLRISWRMNTEHLDKTQRSRNARIGLVCVLAAIAAGYYALLVLTNGAIFGGQDPGY
jgi:hypothetical protein